jgi:hypothetical protein
LGGGERGDYKYSKIEKWQNWFAKTSAKTKITKLFGEMFLTGKWETL